MKKILAVATFLLVFLCPISQSGAKTLQPPAEAETEKVNAQIVLTTKVSKYGGDENIFVSITFKNLSTADLYFPYRSVEDFYQIQLVGPQDKKPLLPTREKMTAVSGGIRVPHQGKKEAYIWLNRMFDLSHVGKYTLTVSKKIEQKGKETILTSEPLEFEVTSEPTLSGWVNP